MDARVQRLCVWSGLLFMVLFGAGFALAGFIPPPAPTDSALKIAHLFQDHTTRIRVGLVLVSLAAPLQFTWAAVISVQMKRIEGRFSPLAYTQLMSGGSSALLFLVPTLILQGAIFRPNRPPDILLALDDVCWVMFIGATTFALVQGIAIGVAILRDRGAQPVFPRWAGYLNLWVCLVFQGGIAVVFFKTGPLAWRNLFAWWIPLTVFGAWFIVMTVLLLRAVHDQETGLAAQGTSEPTSELQPV